MLITPNRVNLTKIRFPRDFQVKIRLSDELNGLQLSPLLIRGSISTELKFLIRDLSLILSQTLYLNLKTTNLIINVHNIYKKV